MSHLTEGRGELLELAAQHERTARLLRKAAGVLRAEPCPSCTDSPAKLREGLEDLKQPTYAERETPAARANRAAVKASADMWESLQFNVQQLREAAFTAYMDPDANNPEYHRGRLGAFIEVLKLIEAHK